MRRIEGEDSVELKALGARLESLRMREPRDDERMRRSLDRHGQLTAVTVFEGGGGLQLVDGFKRLRAATELGWSHLRASVLALEEANAIAALLVLNESPGLTELEQGWVVHALHRTHGLSQGAVAQLMGKHKSWVCRRLMLVQSLDEAVQVDVRLGLLPPRSAIAVAALPRGNQQQAAELVVRRGMTTRQAELLVRRLCELDDDAQRAHAMERWPEASPAPSDVSRTRTRSDAETLMADIATLQRVGVRVEVRLLASPLSVLGPDAASSARHALGELTSLLGSLDRAITRALALPERLDDTDATLAHP
jgi:ParB-like chromosome segregation protein Spo0J